MDKKSYVYELIDPDTKKVFYVGKGTGYRDRSHLKPSCWSNPQQTTNPFLYYKIKTLMDQNKTPIIRRVKEDLTDNEAYVLEAALIEKYGRRFSSGGGQLFNISEFQGGNPSGTTVKWTEERRRRHKEFCRKRRIYDPTYEELFEEYYVKRRSREDIGNANGCSAVLVKKRLQEYGITRPRTIMVEYQCQYCGCIFSRPPSSQNPNKYCSLKCVGKAKSDRKRSN